MGWLKRKRQKEVVVPEVHVEDHEKEIEIVDKRYDELEERLRTVRTFIDVDLQQRGQRGVPS